MHEPDPRERLTLKQTSATTNTPNPQQIERNDSESTPISQSLSPTTVATPIPEGRLPQSAHPAPQHTANTEGVDFALLGGYGFPPGGPLVWNDWNSNFDFREFSTFFQPQGELAEELQAQQPSTNEFSIPTRVPPLDTAPSPFETQFTAPFEQPGPYRRPASIPTFPRSDHDPPDTSLLRAQSMVDLISNSQNQMAETSTSRSHAGGPAISTRAGMKRKAGSDIRTSHSAPEHSTAKRPSMARPSLPGLSPKSRLTRSQGTIQDSENPDDADAPTPAQAPAQAPDESEALQRSESAPTKTASALTTKDRKIGDIPSRLTTILPAGKVFPIQIGSELFRLSGASLSSDCQSIKIPSTAPNIDFPIAPSYFSHYFGEQLIQTGGRASQIKTLYIDRDPNTFKDIALHLQGTSHIFAVLLSRTDFNKAIL
jgi:hypothetical protein